MTNPKGQRFRHDVVQFCRTVEGVVAESIPQAGAKDESDLFLAINGEVMIAELKATKTLDSSGFLKQAFEERDNWAEARNWGGGVHAPPFAGFIWKRPRQPISQALFGTTLSEIIRITRGSVPF